LGDALSPQAGSQLDEVAEVDVSQDGQALSSSIEASQVLATEDFSSSTPRDGTEDQIHSPDGDTTPVATQPPHPQHMPSLTLQTPHHPLPSLSIVLFSCSANGCKSVLLN